VGGAFLHVCIGLRAVSFRMKRAPVGVDYDTIFTLFPHMRRLYASAGLSGYMRHGLVLFFMQVLAVGIHTFRRGHITLRDCLFSTPAVVSQLYFVYYNSNAWRQNAEGHHPGLTLSELESDCNNSEHSTVQRWRHRKLVTKALEVGLYVLTAWELQQKVVLPLAARWRRKQTNVTSLIADGIAAVCKTTRIIQSMAGSGIVASYTVLISVRLRHQIQREKDTMQATWKQFYRAMRQDPQALQGDTYMAIVKRLTRLGAPGLSQHQEQENQLGLFLEDISRQWRTLDWFMMGTAALLLSLVLPSFTVFGQHIREAISKKHWQRVIRPMVVGDTYMAEAIRLLTIAILAFHQGKSLQSLTRSFSKQLQYQEWQWLTLAAEMPETDLLGFRATAMLRLLAAAHKNLSTWDINLRAVQGSKLLSEMTKLGTRLAFSTIVMLKAASSIRGSFPTGFIDAPLFMAR